MSKISFQFPRGQWVKWFSHDAVVDYFDPECWLVTNEDVARDNGVTNICHSLCIYSFNNQTIVFIFPRPTGTRLEFQGPADAYCRPDPVGWSAWFGARAPWGVVVGLWHGVGLHGGTTPEDWPQGHQDELTVRAAGISDSVDLWYHGTGSFLQNTHDKQPRDHPWGGDMGCHKWVLVGVLPYSLEIPHSTDWTDDSF